MVRTNVKPQKFFLDFCVDWIETGKYISTEFRLGHVYDGENGTNDDMEDIILYRPVYVRVVDKPKLDRISKEMLVSRSLNFCILTFCF
jgi:hypothetical protein